MASQVTALFSIGHEAQREGRLEDAERAYRAVLDEEPEHTGALHYLGVQQLQGGNIEEAVRLLRRAGEAAPDRADVQSNLAVALRAAGQLQQAVNALDRSVALNPERPEPWLVLGDVLMQTGEYSRALEAYRKNLSLAPENPGGLLGLGRALQGLSRHAEAEHWLERAHGKAPDNGGIARTLAWVYYQTTRFNEALALFDRLARAREFRRDALLGMALTELQLARPGRALECLETLEKEGMEDARHVQIRAAAENMAGNEGEAVLLYRECLNHFPGNTQAWYELASFAPEHLSDKDTATIAELERGAREPEKKSQAAFALARVYQYREQWEQEFHALERANAAQREVRPYRREEFEQRFRMQREIMDTDFFERTRGAGRDDVRPLFVLGMPRSGTSVTEQVLSCHSQVGAAGESIARPVALKALRLRRGIVDQAALLRDASPEMVREFADEYLRYTREDLGVTAPIFTDKSVTNFGFVPLLAAAFPDARFIVLRRDPVDLCFGCFRILFSHGQEFSFDLADCAHHLGQFERMIHHWRETFPDITLYELRYEAFIADQAGQTEALLTHCGLDWEDACLDFQRNRRAVATASQNQLRQGLDRRGVDRAARYGSLLAPLREALHRQGLIESSGG